MKIYRYDGTEYNEDLLKCVNIDGVDYLKVDVNDTQYQVLLNYNKIVSEYSAIEEDDFIEIIDKEKSTKLFFSEVNRKEDKRSNPFVIPNYKTYPESTAILGILYAHNNYKEWLYNNYILLWAYTWIWDNSFWCDFKFGNYLIQEKFCKMINKEYVDKKQFDSQEKAINYFEQTLMGNYIFVALDMIVIDSIWVNKQQKRDHGNHTVLFYGFNPVKREFYCADFIEGIYKKYTLSYDLFWGAFLGGFYGGEQQFIVWNYKNEKEELDRKLILAQIKDFVKCTDTTRNSFLNLNVYYNVEYGFEALERIKRRMYELYVKNKKLDLRALNIINMNVLIMKERISYLEIVDEGHQEINNIEKNLLKKLKKLELLTLRYNIKRNEKDVDKYIANLDDIINDIKLYYNAIIYAMNDNYSEIDKLRLWNKWDELKSISPENNGADVYELEKNMDLIMDTLKEGRKLKEGIDYINKIKNKSERAILTSDFYENVFPFEIEEDGFMRNGQIIEESTSQIDNKKYFYDDKKRISLIEYIDSRNLKCWLHFKYEGDTVLRLKYREKFDDIIIDNIKLLVDKDCYKYLYSYKPSIKERKIIKYFYKNAIVEKFERFECRDNSIPMKLWVDDQWAKKGKYIYSKNGELLQILLEDYEKKVKTIYTNLNRQYGEEKIKADFNNYLNQFLPESKCIKIVFKKKEHKIIIEDLDKLHNKEVYSFLDEYELVDSELKRISKIISLEIYLAQKKWKDRKLFYYADDLKVDISKVDFMK